MKIIFLLLSFLFVLACNSQIKNYVFIGMDRDFLKDTNSWNRPCFEGVQIAYSWRQLEHPKDSYDFSMIREDLDLLRRHGKKLFIQIQDVSFSMKHIPVPAYLLQDSIYHGGVNTQYRFKDATEKEFAEAGHVARRWDPEVKKRLHKLYEALGKQFDGKIAGINTEETSVDFGKGPLHPPGFTYKIYEKAVEENLLVLRRAFPNTELIAYINFMPGGYLPSEDSFYLRSIYDFAVKKNIGVGGPDLLPYKPGQMNNSYGFIKNVSDKVPAGVAVQDGTYKYINPKTEQAIKASELYSFGKDYLRLRYIFWCVEEPFFHSEVIPFLESLR